ncbi:Isochorismatase family protein YecD [Sodalis glossinidius str. 'morsitans']|uniref:Isochorismatase n=1 Tax=Sodalis glossinidius (strain morsitans) TaxID=343509 RepID=Q2NTJ4_SODGM|nr:putative isochorismatase [Sodalis glossinidius str. 'morsitans']CRL45249.1 Isochorismatase family protein YecD [Sodalis glossinidius str. 'morsitans']
MLKLNPSRSALVLIDLQKGILPFAGGPHSAADVVKRAAELAQGFRDANAPVFLVRVGWSADFADALKQPVDSASGGTLPANWWDIPADLRAQDSDIRIIKRQWGAFYGTELEMQLRRRGIETIVLGGAFQPISAWNSPRVMPGNWALSWCWWKIYAAHTIKLSTTVVSSISSRALAGYATTLKCSPPSPGNPGWAINPLGAAASVTQRPR